MESDKCFVTFPFPYQNGALHLGHAYTISKVEFFARYKKMQGCNVLFPYGFHCTGMPIVASAQKLAESLQRIGDVDIKSLPYSDQVRILTDMGVPRDELHTFTDINKWFDFFPKRSITDLQKFNCCIDYRRSFITTSANPYYDLFVKWQFEHLRQKDYVRYSKRPVIYSAMDKQICGDHDRNIGEEVGVKKYGVYFATNSEYTMIITLEKYVPITDILISGDERMVMFEWRGKKYTSTELFFSNFKHQCAEGIKYVCDVNASELSRLTFDFYGTNISVVQRDPDAYSSDKSVQQPEFDESADVCIVTLIKHWYIDYSSMNLKKKTNDYVCSDRFKSTDEQTPTDATNKSVRQPEFCYYEPADLVTSRTGDVCVAALIEHWYVDYSSMNLKTKVNDYIRSDRFKSTIDKQIFIDASNALTYHPCSKPRNVPGTQLFNTDQVIDSLSDSTIYMAYYTIAHRITSIFLDVMRENYLAIFNFIFLDGDMPSIGEDELLQGMKNKFRYWYPVDLRVSGEDLINNHMIMTLYNHMMIWDTDMLPTSFAINGYITLDGRRMSKSNGTFMTLSDAIDKFGSDATRLVLAGAGVGMVDADFSEKNAIVAASTLAEKKKWCECVIDELLTSDKTYESKVADSKFQSWIQKINEQYEQMNYKYIADNIFDKIECDELYSNVAVIKQFLQVLYPICPDLVESMWKYGARLGLGQN